MMPYISESNIKPIEAAWLSVCIRGGAPLWSKSIYHWIITLTKRMSPSCHSTQTHTIFHIKFTAFFVCACVSRLPKDGEGRIKMEGNTRIFYLRIELIEDKERERERAIAYTISKSKWCMKTTYVCTDAKYVFIRLNSTSDDRVSFHVHNKNLFKGNYRFVSLLCAFPLFHCARVQCCRVWLLLLLLLFLPLGRLMRHGARHVLCSSMNVSCACVWERLFLYICLLILFPFILSVSFGIIGLCFHAISMFDANTLDVLGFWGNEFSLSLWKIVCAQSLDYYLVVLWAESGEQSAEKWNRKEKITTGTQTHIELWTWKKHSKYGSNEYGLQISSPYSYVCVDALYEYI